MSAKSNLLLQALPDAERAALAPHLVQAELKQQRLLFDIREAITDVYFAADAVVSLVIPLSTGEVVETAMVGRDGLHHAAHGVGLVGGDGNRRSGRFTFAADRQQQSAEKNHLSHKIHGSSRNRAISAMTATGVSFRRPSK